MRATIPLLTVVKLGISINYNKVFESIKAYRPQAGFQNLVTEAMAHITLFSPLGPDFLREHSKAVEFSFHRVSGVPKE